MLLARICLVDSHCRYHETTLDVTHEDNATARGLALWLYLTTRRRPQLRSGPLLALWTVLHYSDSDRSYSVLSSGYITGHGSRHSSHLDSRPTP